MTLKLSLILKHDKYFLSQNLFAISYHQSTFLSCWQLFSRIKNKKKFKIKTGHLVYLRNNSMWTTAGAIFSTTSAIKLYLCLRLFGCSWPEIETEDMSWVLQVTAGGSLQNTWIKKSSKWVSFPSLKVICSLTLGPRFPPCFSAQKWNALPLGKRILVWSAPHWAMGQRGFIPLWCPGLRHCRSTEFILFYFILFPGCTAHSPFVKGILYSDASTAALLFWMVYLASTVFSH